MLIVLTTVPDLAEGKAIAHKIVEARLGACVQVLPKMSSVYLWDGAVQDDDEHLVLIKTVEEKFSELESFISKHHSYEVPEIVGLKASNASAGYLEWMSQVLAPTD